jgi:hypothetical protein
VEGQGARLSISFDRRQKQSRGRHTNLYSVPRVRLQFAQEWRSPHSESLATNYRCSLATIAELRQLWRVMRRLLAGLLLLATALSLAAQKLAGVPVGKPAPIPGARSVRERANTLVSDGTQRSGASVLPLGRLVTLLLTATGSVAECTLNVPPAGRRVAAISYDSEAILGNVTQRHRIEYPLIADPKSEIIRS